MGTAAAFFDLDRTLIRGSANFPLAIAAFRAGHIRPKDLLRDTAQAISFIVRGASDEGSAKVRERILLAVSGVPAADVIALGDNFIPKLATRVLPESQALLDLHAARGEDRVIVSASPVEIVGRLADELGLEGACGTRSEIDAQGRYTGKLAGAFCYKEGKVTEIVRLADERGYELAQCTAYSDSISDLPFLEAVGTAVAVNPDKPLRAHAGRHGWRIVEVSGRGTGAGRYVRSGPVADASG